MFRDLKEYQEIAKIYAEKVSKPENLEERRGASVEQLKQNRADAIPNKPAPAPQGGAGGGVGNPTNVRGSGVKPRPKPEVKKFPSTAEIRAAAAAKRGGTPAIGGGNAGASTDSGGTSKSTIKSVPVQKDKPEVSTMTKQGKPRTKAQMMAAKRIADGKSISDVKAENQASMKARAKAKFEAFKKRREEKKAGMSEGVTAIPTVAGGIGKALGATAAGIGAAGMMMKKKINPMDFGKSKRTPAEKAAAREQDQINKGNLPAGAPKGASKVEQGKADTGSNIVKGSESEKPDMGSKPQKSPKKLKGFGEEFTPYDIVLEYLLSTEQVATIEEANYVMTEMDAETIQAIVKEGSMMDAPDDVKAAAKRQYKAGSPGAEPYTVDDKKTIINYYKNKKGQV